jgi:hypothetical protein
MGLISFSDQFHSFLESQSIEENPPLEKAIKKAEDIITKSNEAPMTSQHSLQAMKNVSACFKNFPEVRKGLQDIIRSEIAQIERLGEEVLLHKRPAEEEAIPEEPATKKRKREQPEEVAGMEVEEAEEEAVSGKRVREKEIEGAPPAKISPKDPWVEYQSTNLLVQIFKQPITFSSPVELPRVIAENMERALSEFESEAKENSKLRPRQIQAVKKQVQERVKLKLDQLAEVDPSTVEKVRDQIHNVGQAFILSSYKKVLEQFDPTIEVNILTLMQDAENEGLDIRPMVQKIYSHPLAVQKQLFKLLSQSSFELKDLTDCFQRLSQFLQTGKLCLDPMGLLDKNVKLEDGPAILKFIEELTDKIKEHQKERDLLVDECVQKIPFLKIRMFSIVYLGRFLSKLLPIPSHFYKQERQ